MPISPWIYWDQEARCNNLWELLDDLPQLHAYAAEHKISVKALGKELNRHGRPINAITPDERAQSEKQIRKKAEVSATIESIKHMYQEERLTIGEIATKLEQSPSYVYRQMKLGGINRRFAGRRPGKPLAKKG